MNYNLSQLSRLLYYTKCMGNPWLQSNLRQLWAWPKKYRQSVHVHEYSTAVFNPFTLYLFMKTTIQDNNMQSINKWFPAWFLGLIVTSLKLHINKYIEELFWLDSHSDSWFLLFFLVFIFDTLEQGYVLFIPISYFNKNIFMNIQNTHNLL